MTDLIKELDIDQVVFGYSDVSYDYVMHRASMVLAAGADFRLMGGKETMLQARVPVVSVCAVRTGCGKSQTSRRLACIATVVIEFEKRDVSQSISLFTFGGGCCEIRFG